MTKESKEPAAKAGAEESPAVADRKTPAAAKRTEAEYSVRELAGNAAGLFGTRQECVLAALKAEGKENATVSEARRIVGTFLKKEVR